MFTDLQKSPFWSCFQILALTYSLIGFIGCEESEEAVAENFAKVYAELRVATEGNRHRPESGNETRRLILAKYGLNPQVFERNMRLLKENKEKWVTFQEDVIQYLEELEKIKTSNKGE
jgi:hypothetical protein